LKVYMTDYKPQTCQCMITKEHYISSTRTQPDLDYVKTILVKVSFAPEVFSRELSKAIGTLHPLEVKSLENWCYRHFSDYYAHILDECFEACFE
jgi:hypothetical protein